MKKYLSTIYFLGFLVFAFMIYYPALHGKYFMDDFDHFTNECSSFFDFFSSTCRRWYQPLAFSLVKTDVLLQNNSAWITHSTAIFLHGLYGWLIFRVLSCFVEPISAIFGALFFLFHPLAVTSVAWVGEIHQAMVSVFAFLSVWFCYLYNISSDFFKRNYILCFFFFILSILSKESGVNAFIMITIITLALNWKNKKISKLLIALIPFLIIFLFYSCIRLFWMENIQFSGEQDYRMVFGLNIVENLGRYWVGFCSPFSTVYIYQLLKAHQWMYAGVLLTLFIIPILIILFYFLKNNPRSGILIILLLLAGSLPYILLRKASEAYTYQPLGVYALLMGFMSSYLWKINKRLMIPVYIYMGVFVAISFISVRSKISYLLKNGDAAEKIIKEVLVYQSEIEKVDSLIMYDEKKDSLNYSIYLQEGFQLIFNAPGVKNIINVRIKRNNLMARVVPLHRMPEIRITENVVALVYERGRVRRLKVKN